MNAHRNSYVLLHIDLNAACVLGSRAVNIQIVVFWSVIHFCFEDGGIMFFWNAGIWCLIPQDSNLHKYNLCFMRPQNVKVVNINIAAFWDVMLCRLTEGYQLFRRYTASISKVEPTWHCIPDDHSLNLRSSD
jgi:hypothetical protein